MEEWAPGGAAAAASGPTPEQCWGGIQCAGAAHLSPAMGRLFGVSLAARQYSPRLEMFRQLAEASRAELAAAGSPAACCWALLGGRAYTEAALLEAALAAVLSTRAAQHEAKGGGAGAVYPFDHIYSPPGAAAPPLNITAPTTVPVELFAPLGSTCGAELHAVLAVAVTRSEAAAAASAEGSAPPRLAYAWRPVLHATACSQGVHACTSLGTQGPLVLPGYGVELALKNMEYSAQDDSKTVRWGNVGGWVARGGDGCAGGSGLWSVHGCS